MNLTENLPPPLYDLDAEQTFLGGMLCYPEQLGVACQNVTADDFYDPLHREVFKAMLEVWAGGREVSHHTVKQAMRAESLADAPAYLQKLAAVGMVAISVRTASLVPLCAKIADLAAKRRIVVACAEADYAARHNEQASCDIAGKLAGEMTGVLSGSGESWMRSEHDTGLAILDDMRRDTNPVSTGLARLDAIMDGGLFPGFSYGIAARKKCGKTMLLSTVSYHLSLAGVKHLYIAAEMTDTELQKRKLAYSLGVFSSAFRTPSWRKNAHFQQQVAAKVVELGSACVYVRKPGISFESLKTAVMIAVYKHKISGFILDYWQLVSGKPAGKSTAEHLDEVAQWVANFSREHGLWSLTAAQINQGENTRGGEGIRLAFDMVLALKKQTEESTEAWLEMMDTRYTKWSDMGSETAPSLHICEKGPMFEQLPWFEGDAA